VFLHGNSLDATFWENQVNAEIFKNYNCIAIDIPGHGKSLSLKNYSLKNIIAEISKDLQLIESYVLVGHSLGGQIAIQTLKDHSLNCQGIVMVGAPPILPSTNLMDVYNINETSLLLLKSDLSEKESEALARFLSPEGKPLRDKIKKGMNKTDSTFREQYAASLNEKSFYDEIEILKHFRGKKVIINGINDPLINLAYIDEIAVKLNIPSQIISECGHFPQIEKPQKFNGILLEFLKNLK
jgi:pimeloyl-ACP methyl ester carboxylesterase